MQLEILSGSDSSHELPTSGDEKQGCDATGGDLRRDCAGFGGFLEGEDGKTGRRARARARDSRDRAFPLLGC